VQVPQTELRRRYWCDTCALCVSFPPKRRQ
jgi:hypothetical protein